MAPSYDWQFTHDLDEFLAHAGAFLHSRPALHTVPLTVTDTLRERGTHLFGDQDPLFGFLADGDGGDVRAALFHTPPHVLNVTPLTADEADALVAGLFRLGHPAPGVSAEDATAAAVAEAWQRAAGGAARIREHQRLYRLGELSVPQPVPEGRARTVGAADRKLLMRWFKEFNEVTGGGVHADPGPWADARISYGGVTLWETLDGTPVSMAGVTRPIAGQIRVAPVYTPSHLRGNGYAGAVTAEVSRAATAAGAAEVLLFTDLANPTSNALYQRIGYREVTDFTVYGFGD
ncbi:GNAT family N-acetyltransferase [Streptomyces sp. NPDC086787]|uniref:GNAT family N-acetyltransferase n=1 Tax=Streptomyces sp. NPDC086787 TaxID=3365759 RepID=UPI0037FE35A0